MSTHARRVLYFRLILLNGVVLTIRTVRTASGATAVQVIRYANNKRVVVKHMGSAHTDDELAVLRCEAERVCEQLSPQLSLFSSSESPVQLMHLEHLTLQAVTHRIAYEALRQSSQLCGLGFLSPLYQRGYVREKGMTPIIPRHSNSPKSNPGFDKYVYKIRHLVENLFARLKPFRSIATRFEKLARNFKAMVFIACTFIRLKLK